MMKLKFCGFTSIEDVTAASQLPIDAIDSSIMKK